MNKNEYNVVKLLDMTRSNHKFVYWVPYHRILTNSVYFFIVNNTEQSLANFTTKPGENFLLAIFYHLLTIHFGVGDYCLSNCPTSCLFSSQSSSLYWLRSANTDKTITPNCSKQEGPNQRVHRSYPTLQDIYI